MNITVILNALVVVLSPIVVYFVARPGNRQRVLEYTLSVIDRETVLIATLLLGGLALALIL